MTWPIQRQSESYGAFDDDSLHFAKDYTTRDLPEGLVNMLKGPRISAGMNNPRQADLGDAMNDLGSIPGDFNAAGNASGGGLGSAGAWGDAFSSIGDNIGDAAGSLFAPTVTQGTAVPESAPATTNINARRRQAGMHDTRYDPRVDGYPEPYGEQPSMSDLYAHEPHQMGHEEFEQEYPGGEPHHYTEDAFREQPQTPLQPLNEMLEHSRRPDMEPPPHDYLAQFRPHLASFTEARLLKADGPAPSTTKEALAVAPQAAPPAAPGWIGHGYAPGHRVGLPWRATVIPGTVTHLDGQTVGIRWDDGQHSTEEPSDLRPL